MTQPILNPPPDIPKLTTFGWQAGPEGFVRYGLKPPIDYLFMGAFYGRSGGKTEAGARRMLLYQIANPGSMGLVTIPVNDTLYRATLPTIEKLYRQMNIPYEYNYTRREMVVDLGRGNLCTVFFASTDDPSHIPGPTCAFAWMDEAAGSSWAAFGKLMPTLRQAGYPHQMWFTTTPLGPYHWLVRLFAPQRYIAPMNEHWDFEEFEKTQKELGITYKLYTGSTYENPFVGKSLGDAMVATMGRNNPMLRQELYGEIVSMEGLVYPTWDSAYHVVPRDKWPTKKPTRVIAGVDFGFENPCAILVVGYDAEGRYYLMDEYYRNHISHEELSKAAKSLQKKWGIQYFMCDSQGASWISAMRQAGLPALRANKKVGSASDISSGIGMVTAAMNKKLSDGSQAFFVAPELLHYRREKESYSLLEINEDYNPKETPRKRMDHEMDCERYAVMGINRFWGRGEYKPQAIKLRWTN